MMKKIYNCSGIEVKRPIMGVCSTCGYWKCGGYQHCLRYRQLLRFNSYEWDSEHYSEIYRTLDEEIAALDSTNIRNVFTGEPMRPLPERRKEILEGINITEFDMAELHKADL